MNNNNKRDKTQGGWQSSRIDSQRSIQFTTYHLLLVVGGAHVGEGLFQCIADEPDRLNGTRLVLLVLHALLAAFDPLEAIAPGVADPAFPESKFEIGGPNSGPLESEALADLPSRPRVL